MTFALAGIGYIAEKHLQAIKAVGGELVLAHDVKDSVGILDKYFPQCEFTLNRVEFEDKLKGIDYLVVCTPNHTHKGFIETGHEQGCKIICEKPLVLKESDFTFLPETNTILQLRLHPEFQKISGSYIHIDYQTPRGDWYYKSWKGNRGKSGGLLMNIGVHLFDLMIYHFGYPQSFSVHEYTDSLASGTMLYKERIIDWRLSLTGDKIVRKINNADLSDTSYLHVKSYEEILAGRGFKNDSVKPTIKFINEMQDYVIQKLS